MKKKKLGIFVKVFLYTLSFLIAVIGLTALFFTQQFNQIFEEGQRRGITDNVRPLVVQLSGKPEHAIQDIAEAFHERNIYLHFYIVNSDGELLYETPAINNDEIMKRTPEYMAFLLSDGMTLHVYNQLIDIGMEYSLTGRSAVALLVMLMISIFVSYAFARGITKPILMLAEATGKMSKLENVPIPKERNDEIGLLTNDVYQLYSTLKTEIERVKEIEENQRHFFSAASHELKTPVASTMVLLQGMLDGIGDYKDHPKYLRKCMDKMNAQSMIISEMLEIVRLTGGNAKLHYENIDIRSIIEQTLSSHQPLIEAKELSVDIDLPDAPICRTDRLMLSRSLSNVVMNAVQNTPEKKSIKIWSEAGNNNTMRLFILNTGTHIDEDERSKWFEPFYRVDKARSMSQGRSGLGLAIVKKSLELIHSDFSLENKPEGVLFWMELPHHNEGVCKISVRTSSYDVYSRRNNTH